jgi:chromosome segregation ATPase
MPRFSRLLSLLAFTLPLGACAVSPQECDPRNADAGFSTKFGCNVHGGYAQRIEQKEKILLDERRTNQLFRDTYAALDKERSEVGRELDRQRSEYAALNKAMNALLAELKQKGRNNQRLQNEIAALEKDMASINRQNDNTAVAQKQYELQKLRTRLAGLESDLGLR